MNTTDFIICCRRLVGALRGQPQAEGHATFFLGFDAEGLPFYKAGSFNAGQLTSAFTEPLFFCPFCGRRVREGADEAAAAARRSAPRRARAEVEDGGEELTRTALEETREVETAIAPRGAYAAAAAGAGGFAGSTSATHFSDFTSAGLAKSDSGTGALSSTFS